MSEFYYLRNVVSTDYQARQDGRFSYKADRSSAAVWAPASTTDAHLLAIYGDHRPDIWVIYAWDTQRPGCPPDPDTYTHWQYAPQILRLETDWSVRLGGLGPGYPEPSTCDWVPEFYKDFVDPRDSSGETKLDFIRLSPLNHPGYYLGLDWNVASPSTPIPDSSLALCVRNTPAQPAVGWPWGSEWWWTMEPAPHPASASSFTPKHQAIAMPTPKEAAPA